MLGKTEGEGKKERQGDEEGGWFGWHHMDSADMSLSKLREMV